MGGILNLLLFQNTLCLSETMIFPTNILFFVWRGMSLFIPPASRRARGFRMTASRWPLGRGRRATGGPRPVSRPETNKIAQLAHSVDRRVVTEGTRELLLGSDDFFCKVVLS